MKQIIELKDTQKRKMIAKHFGISLPNLSQTLRFKRNGVNAEAIRTMAKENGGILYTVTGESKVVKILDSKGCVKKVVTE